MSYALTVMLRYLSMVLQFFTLIFVSRHLSLHDVGIYYSVFGLVNTTYFLAGIGLPDGLVKWVAHAVASGDSSSARSLIHRAGAWTLGFIVLFSLIAIPVARHSQPFPLVLLTVGWWACYGVLFFASQVLVALRQVSWGAFFFYPASSIGLFATSVPYLFFSRKPDIIGTLEATAWGALACAVASVLCAAVYLDRLPRSSSHASLRPIFQLGALIAVARVLQTSLYWIPVWGIGLHHDAGAVGLMGTASRLNAAIAAVMAAIRFTIRPLIVKHAADNNWHAIAQESRRVATVGCAFTLAAFAGTLTIGPWVIGMVFGSAYRSASVLIAVLLIGTMGECIGGPVDEILKMTGKAQFVTGALIVTAGVEGLLIWLTASRSGAVIAGIQSAVFVSMYVYFLWLVWRRNGVYVGAGLSFGRFPAAVKENATIE